MVYLLLWGLYCIHHTLRDKYLKQQTIWPDIKTNVSYLLHPQDINTTTENDWRKLLQKQTPVDWTETFPPENTNGTSPHTHINKTNGYKYSKHNTLYRLQQVYKQIQDGSMNKFHFDVICVTISTSIQLNEVRNLQREGTLKSSRCNQVHRRTGLVNGTLGLNTKFTSQQYVYRLAHVEKQTKIENFTKSICQLT